MAKRTRVPAQVSRAVGVRIEYTPETLENIRYRIEQTDESMISIAADVGVHRNTLRLLKLREKWERKVVPRDLSPAVKLLAQAQKLEEETQAPPEPIQPEVSIMAPLADDAVVEETPLPGLPSTIERLNRAVLEELAAVEAMRAHLIHEPQSPVDAERTARTLSTLTETLQRLRRLQCALTGTGPENNDHDDHDHADELPLDIDEFRRELARRIDEFVASRADAGGDGASAA